MSDAPQGSFTDKATDALFRLVLSGLRALPYERRIPAMGRLMRHGVAPAAGYMRRSRQHLARIYPGWSAAQARATARAAADNAGRSLMELYSGPEFAARMAQTALEGAGVAALEQMRAQGTPVIFVTGHFGNHEAPRHALLARGYQIGGLYRPMKNPYFDAHYARTMTDFGGPVFAQGRRGTMGFTRHVARGGMATLLFDVAAGGAVIPFLGHGAHTSLSAAQIALRTKAAMVPYFGIRQDNGLDFRVVIEEPIAPGTPEEMMRAATARLEAHIHRHPEQYFWPHRRWKNT